jgi:hypothetical protein
VYQLKRELDLDDTGAKGPTYHDFSGVPGLGKPILGPHISDSSNTASTTIARPLDNIAISSNAEVDTGHIPRKVTPACQTLTALYVLPKSAS